MTDDREEPRSKLDYRWEKKRAADGWLILDEFGNFIETFYNDEVGDRIIADHNALLAAAVDERKTP